MNKFLLITLSSLFFSSCFYNDYKYKESLESNFYLMESDVLPSKYISIEKSNSGLILIYDVEEIFGNNKDMLVKTNDNGQITYNLIRIDIVEYPEDVKKISSEEFSKRKKLMKLEYSYNENNGLKKYFFRH